MSSAPGRRAARRAVRIGFVVVTAALLVWGVAAQWGAVRAELAEIGLLPALGAQTAVLAGLFASALAWRAVLADMGSPLAVGPASRVFFVGQLGKYLPGSVWAVLGQVELARDHGAQRRHVGATALVVMGLNVTTGLLTAAAVLPFTSRDALAGGYAWLLLALPVGIVALHPRVLTPLVGLGFRVLRRPPLERPLSLRGIGVAVAWTEVMWLCYGVHILLLGQSLGGDAGDVRHWALATAAFAGAWTAGFLFVVSPAGVGVREGVLVLALSPMLSTAAATAVAVVSRVVMTMGDLVWAVLAGGLRSRLPQPPRERGVDAGRGPQPGGDRHGERGDGAAGGGEEREHGHAHGPR